MRTTIAIDDDVLRAAKYLARDRSISLGTAVSELMRKGLNENRVVNDDGGFPVFRISPGSPPLTLEEVRRAEDEP